MSMSKHSVATDAISGEQLHQLIAELYPIMRSITGPGVRESLARLQVLAPVEIRGIPSGTPVLDWTVPEEWHFQHAFIEDPDGQRLVDTNNSNLHVVNFSVPVEATLTREELLPHLHTLPEQPTSIPYRTTYYADQWGFCLSQQTLDTMGPGPFTVRIDAERKPGVLNYGELFIPGKSTREILVSTHICHPQLANDNLSGMVLAAALAGWLSAREPELSWRFVFVPGTIGAISWLASNQTALSNIIGGLVITGLGDDSPFHWKQTREGTLWIDRLMTQCLQETLPDKHRILPFTPYG